jgi:hypothetical protein
MTPSSFPPQGDQNSRIEGRLLVTRVIGTWNLEQHRRSQQQIMPLVERLESSGPWASLVIIEDTLVSSLDVLEAGRQAVAAGVLAHLRALAWVIGPTVEGRAILLPRYRRIYDGLLPSAVFEATPEAAAWLQQQLGDAAR